MGMIGKRLSELLTGFGFRVIAQDPFLSDEQAMEIGVEKVSLEELFSRAYIASNHIPDLPSTKKVPDQALFDSMRAGATFIPNGKGAQVDEAGLIATHKNRRDRSPGRNVPGTARRRV